MLELDRAEFEAAVETALDRIPEELSARVHNVVVLVEDEPDPDAPELLGIYEGRPMTEESTFDPIELPSRILIFRGPLTRLCDTREQLEHEIGVTVVHEVAHHFGIDDARLAELGYA